MVFDSDILVWHLRGYLRATSFMEAEAAREMSVVTYMELLRGVRDKEEFRKLKSFLAEFSFRMLPLSESIGHRAAIYMEQFSLKIAMSVPDALLAATAAEHGLPLATGNTKHFPPMDGLDLRPFSPR
jgi:hypothetical protein